MARLLVLGATGMLGHVACRRLADAGHEVTGTVRRPIGQFDLPPGILDGVTVIDGVDVLNEADLDRAMAAARPEVVVNCVGLVKQRPEAEDRGLAVAINSLLPHRLARRCDQAGGRLVHISTDCVFSGRDGNYREDCPPDAVDVYGCSKFLGETTGTEPAAVTLRTSIIGPEVRRPTFGLLEWFLSQAGGSVKGFTGAIWSGLTTVELARVIDLVVRERPELCGVYHVGGEAISKHDLLHLLRDIYDVSIDIHPDGQARCDRSLCSKKFHEATGYVAPPLARMIRDMRDLAA